MAYAMGDLATTKDSAMIENSVIPRLHGDMAAMWPDWVAFIVNEIEAGRCPPITPLDIISSFFLSFAAANILSNIDAGSRAACRDAFLRVCARTWDQNERRIDAARSTLQ